MDHSRRQDAADEIGPPLEALSSCDVEVSPGFWDRLHRRIERRNVTSQAIEFGWNAPLTVLLEFLGIAFGLFGPTTPTTGNHADDGRPPHDAH
jgi:hypothetical protein